MKRLSLLLLLILTFACPSSAQITVQETRKIKALAQLVSQAMRKGENETVLANYYPKFFASGGREKLLQSMNETHRRLIKGGTLIKSITAGTPEPISTTGSRRFALIPQTMVAPLSGEIYSAQTYLLAVSDNKGARWYIMPYNALVAKKMETLFPEIRGKINIPAFSMHVVASGGM